MQAAIVVRNTRKHWRRKSRQQKLPEAVQSANLATRLIPPFPRRSPFPAWPTDEETAESAAGRPSWDGTRSSHSPPDVNKYKTKALAAHRRWIRRSQVDDAEASGLRKSRQSSCNTAGAVNLMLYVGLGMSCVGLIMTFVGLGERGCVPTAERCHRFQNIGLKLIGPCLLFTGVFLCLLRICLCTVGTACANHFKDDRRELISSEMLRVVQSGRPATHKSRRSGRSTGSRQTPPEATPSAHHEETSTVPVLPPIHINMGPSNPSHGAEVLLDAQVLDRRPSAGSVMSPLTPARRRPSNVEHIDNDLDEMLR